MLDRYPEIRRCLTNIGGDRWILRDYRCSVANCFARIRNAMDETQQLGGVGICITSMHFEWVA